jgi:hypothetical protein
MIWSECTPVARSTGRESRYRNRKFRLARVTKKPCAWWSRYNRAKSRDGPVEDVEGPGFDDDLIEQIHVVHARRGDETHRGDVAPEIQEGVELHRGLPLPEGGPGKQGQAKIDRRRIEGVDGLREVHPEGLGRIEAPRRGNQPLGEVGVDPPVPRLVGMGQGVARDHAPEAHVVQLGLGHPEAGLDIPQALPERELGERQAEELIPAGEGLDLVVTVVPLHTDAELVGGHEVHQLGKDRPATVHGPPPLAQRREYGPWAVARSNR